ncbi:DUF2252 family protein [Cryobacterium sp. TMT2-23]|uniref:DUF2252 family protein n=1 Tax=Cryobacterium sp. TMT2-23 TaxID=1259252 RepID=UPI003512ACE7
MDEGRAGEPLHVLAAAARHEGVCRGRIAETGRPVAVRPRLRLDARPGVRPPGRTPARAYARSGDPIAIAAYLGKSDKFDKSVTDFSERYADQNDRDYALFAGAVGSGRLQAIEGV